ncbi:MAG: carboxylesterase/lipase family protein [Roseiflexaceae bacterium]|nr:carboxylesterase/lipase family protein [Roseiflexaceae bacterium]
MKCFPFVTVLLASALLVAACNPSSTPAVVLPPTAAPSTGVVATPAAPPTQIQTQSGALQGAIEQEIVAFKGIPYAAPPVGDLRWRAPQPAAAWQDVRPATAYGSACPQPVSQEIAGAGDIGTKSEDCLYMNIWTPRPDPATKLPVIVWIHGGAFRIGAAGVVGYSGVPLATRGAVMVSFNYRMGQLGFFAHPALAAENPGGPANFGLLDQIAALTWVQQNIAQFGGDPGNVTIFGQSAGGKSVLALFASPLAEGLFHKGIVQSSYVIPDATLAKALDLGGQVATSVGLNGAEASAAELRAIPAEAFVELPAKLFTSPVVIAGDSVLPRSIENVFAAGEEAALPLIVGNTSNDASIALAFGVEPADLLKRLGAANIVVRALYPGVGDERKRALQATRDVVWTMPARWIADRHAKLAPTWRYYFDYTAVNSRENLPDGVPHGADISYFMGTGDLSPSLKDIFTDEDRQFSRLASEYWFEFARTGTPTASTGPEWPPDDGQQDKTMYFGEMTAVRTNFMKARLDVMIGLVKIIDRVVVSK